MLLDYLCLPSDIAYLFQSVVTGGIRKVRSKLTRSSSTRAVPARVQSRPERLANFTKDTTLQQLGAEEPCNADMSIASTIDGGVAERLVSYGQKFMTSFRWVSWSGPSPDNRSIYLRYSVLSRIANTAPDPMHRIETTPSPDCETSGTSGVHVSGNQTHEASDLLTLSQISPRKVNQPITNISGATPMSPMRASRKRPARDTSEQEARKKGKTANIIPSHITVKSLGPQLPTRQRNKAFGSGSSSRRREKGSPRAARTTTQGWVTKAVTNSDRRGVDTQSIPVDASWGESSGSSSSALRVSRGQNEDSFTGNAAVTQRNDSSTSNNAIGRKPPTAKRVR